MNMLGLLLSFVFIGVIIGIGLLLSRKKEIAPEFVRKVIHIGVSNWWFILLWSFDSIGIALIGPIVFIMVNGLAVYTGAAKVLGISDTRRNLGLVYFPISLLILVLAGFLSYLPMWACGMGVLTMGYGDGLAAIVGKKWGVKRLKNGKSVVGSVVMCIVTMVVLYAFSVGYAFESLWTLPWVIALVATALLAGVLEACTPYGLDNITVPIGTAIISALLFIG